MTTLPEHLLAQNIIDHETLREATQMAQHQQQTLLGYLAAQKIIPSEQLLIITKEYFHLPTIDLENYVINPKVIELIPLPLLEGMKVLPLAKSRTHLDIAIIDPSDHQLLRSIQFHSGAALNIFLARYDQLQNVLKKIVTAKQTSSLTNLDETTIDINAEITTQNLLNNEPLIHFINSVINDAISKQASDIHFEVYEDYCRIRLRLDGVLHEVAQPTKKIAARLAARLKIMAKLDIAEKRIPQDGSFKLNISEHTIDVRVSSCPTLYGEKIVLRILKSGNKLRNIAQLDFFPEQLSEFTKAINKPQGLILVTGPTGSGKTNTLYAALQHLNTIEKNISTVEDPIEIKLTGINQVNINNKADLHFATALRAFLRQDPDIIMVGEIRDAETAEIAIKAAQTGHLVLSTLHTNSALQALTRLSNMGIAAYNIVSSIILITAQRLVRKLCEHCKQPEELSPQIREHFKFDHQTIIYRAVGCKNCLHGYSGRIAVHEVLPTSSDLQQYILANTNDLTLQQKIQQQFLSLSQAALKQVAAGVTSLAEVRRVIDI